LGFVEGQDFFGINAEVRGIRAQEPANKNWRGEEVRFIPFQGFEVLEADARCLRNRF